MSFDDLVKKTIILPRTKFLIKRNRSKDEEILSTWEKHEIYEKSLLDKPNGEFIVHDGPPYANGSVHVGHFVNRVLKDFSLRFHNSLGFRTDFRLAWDTYGLPIEFKVLKNSKEGINNSLELREKCRKYALENIELQRNQLKKIGLFTNYNNYYSTQDFDYQANEVRILGEILKKNLLYRGLKPVYWSWSNQTALAENEVEYFEKEDHSLFFKIMVKDDFFGYKDVSFIVWTTQPWTIPFNKFVAVDPKEKYLLIKKDKELIVVSEYFTKNSSNYFNSNFLIEKSFKGKDILGFKYFYPYPNNKEYIGRVIDGKDYVSTSSGTGIVHIAPPCGPEDFNFAKEERIEVAESLDKKGRLKSDFFVESLRNVFYQKANLMVIEQLQNKFEVFDNSKIVHSYPHDWRDKTPLVYRTTEQWFIKLSPLKNRIKENIEKVSWLPEYSKEKMTSFIEKRDEWCISRQRSWGLPIPSIIIEGRSVLLPEIVEYVAKRIENEGSDFWFHETFKEELGNSFGFLLGEKFEIGKDTLDVWFDSGVLAFSGKVNSWKADLCLEGNDQFRGWFNSSLILSTILKNEASYKKVVSHGFVVDEDGRKMSKSLNNAVDVNKVINEVGVDVLRLWVSSFDFSKEMKLGENVITKVKNSYQKIRNTLRFIIGNLSSSYEFLEDIKKNNLSSYQFSELNNYILSKTWSLALQSKENFFNYKFSNIYNSLNSYCTNDLSSFYFEIIKDTLYCDSVGDSLRREVILVMYSVLQIILKVVSSITPLLAEEAYKEIEIKNDKFFGKESIHLVNFPEFISFGSAGMKNREVKFERFVVGLRKNIFQEIEKMRKEKGLENSSQAKVSLYINDNEQYDYLQSLDLKQIFIVAEVFLVKSELFSIEIKKSSNKKCERCWRMEISFDEDSRHCIRCSKIMDFKNWKI